jgi:hypothetical protein
VCVCVCVMGGQVTAVGIAARRARGHHRQTAAQHEHNDASTVTATDRAHTEQEKAGPAGTGAGAATTATTATIAPFHAFPELPPSGSRTADPESRNAQHQRRQRKQPVPLPPPEPPPRPTTTTGASAPSNPKRRRCMAAARGCWSETDDQRLRHAVKTHEGAGGWRAVAAALGGGRSIRAASGRWKRLRRSDAANCEVVIERQDWIVALKAHGLEYLANGSAAAAAASSVIVASAPAATATVAAAPVGEQELDEAWWVDSGGTATASEEGQVLDELIDLYATQHGELPTDDAVRQWMETLQAVRVIRVWALLICVQSVPIEMAYGLPASLLRRHQRRPSKENPRTCKAKQLLTMRGLQMAHCVQHLVAGVPWMRGGDKLAQSVPRRRNHLPV